MTRFETRLIFPPQWIPLNPHLALCSLAGHLRSRGFSVGLVDLNVQYFRHILTPEFLRASLQKCLNAREYLRTRIPLGLAMKDESEDFAVEASWYLEIDRQLKDQADVWGEVIDYIPEAVATFDRSERFFDPFLLVKAYITIDKALELVSLPYFPSQLRFNDYSAPRCPFTLDALVEFTANPSTNMFHTYLQRETARLTADPVDLYGISINSYSQVVAGLTLARMIKKAAPQAHVTIGGNYFGRVKEAFLTRPEFFETFADTLIVNEGEEPFCELIRALQGEQTLAEVPRLIYYDAVEKSSKFTFRKKPPRMDDVGPQDLEGLELDYYFTPEIVLSTRSSKGCYWQKCTFCDADYGMNPDVRSEETLVAELASLKERYGIVNFEFVDECIFPDYGHRLARRMIDANLDVSWFCNGRTEEANTAELLDLYRKAGLRMVLWGVESGSDRIMSLINKGVDIDRRLDVMRNSANAGIFNFAFVFFGFPSEKREEAQATIDLITGNRDIIHCYGKSIFTLGKHSPLAKKALKMGLVKSVEGRQELNSDYEFSYDEAAGMTRSEVLQMSDKCRDDCYAAFVDPLWMYLRQREVIYLYVRRFGVERMSTHRFTPEQQEELRFLYARRCDAATALALLQHDSP